jgi:endonuclease YncB( thermonuclease family)
VRHRLTALAFALLSLSATAAEISGVVTEVQDGDSLTLASLRYTYRIRLVDIDAPEWGRNAVRMRARVSFTCAR